MIRRASAIRTFASVVCKQNSRALFAASTTSVAKNNKIAQSFARASIPAATSTVVAPITKRAASTASIAFTSNFFPTTTATKLPRMSISFPTATATTRRFYASQSNESEAEARLREILVKGLDSPFCVVKDISGGCGSMYDVYVVSKQFEGKSLVQQHKMVTGLLSNDIKSMHGLTIRTKTPAQHEEMMKGQQQGL